MKCHLKCLCFVFLAFAVSCSGGDSFDSPTTPVFENEDNSGTGLGEEMRDSEELPKEEPELKTTASYQLTFTSNWSRREHLALPSNAHFSPIVLTVHDEGYRLFPIGEDASEAFERVAETGNASDLNDEVRGQIRQGSVLSSLNTEDLFLNRASSQTFKVTVTRDHPYISFVTMIAPSPDWVVGLDSLNMIEDEGFTDFISRDLFAYDGGTEEGDRGGNFSTRNSSTTPRNSISILRGEGFRAPFARVQLERLD